MHDSLNAGCAVADENYIARDRIDSHPDDRYRANKNDKYNIKITFARLLLLQTGL